jgi:predicted AlkP superfamily pyrophosphatase or phosphodiesterase
MSVGHGLVGAGLITAMVISGHDAVPAETPLLPSPETQVSELDPSAYDLEPRHVVIVSEDGMRPDALTPELAPRHFEMMAEGAYARDATTIEQAATLPAHASMLSGVPAEMHGMVWDAYRPRNGYIKVPTVFSATTDRGMPNAMFLGKRKLIHLAAPSTVDYADVPGHLCQYLVDHAARFFVENRPSLMFVHFADPDDAGHEVGWMTPEYFAAVRESDRCLGRLLAAIDSTDAAASTVVIVTADHGGHDRTHWNGKLDSDGRIPWIIRGPGIPPRTVIEGPVVTTDTAATALAALGLPPLPGMTGRAQFYARRH